MRTDILATVILNRAATFAAKAHSGQFRKDGVTPYIVHPLRVAGMLTRAGATDLEVLCGIWHDVPEDCPEKVEDLILEIQSYKFSDAKNAEIMAILDALCKPSLDDGNREKRNVKFARQVIDAGDSAILIKLYDRIDNVLDSPNMGKFAERYVVEETGQLIAEMMSERQKQRNVMPDWITALIILKNIRHDMIETMGWEADPIGLGDKDRCKLFNCAEHGFVYKSTAVDEDLDIPCPDCGYPMSFEGFLP
jgi:hypothetical protein